jgi:hypothetical protein
VDVKQRNICNSDTIPYLAGLLAADHKEASRLIYINEIVNIDDLSEVAMAKNCLKNVYESLMSAATKMRKKISFVYANGRGSNVFHELAAEYADDDALKTNFIPLSDHLIIGPWVQSRHFPLLEKADFGERNISIVVFSTIKSITRRFVNSVNGDPDQGHYPATCEMSWNKFYSHFYPRKTLNRVDDGV